MLVGCPKCKTKLNIPDDRIKPEGSRFKCPKCATVLAVKRPVSAPPQEQPRGLDKGRIIVAHERPDVIERVKAVLAATKFKITFSMDGAELLGTIMKEMPFILILDVALPNIDGFEVARRLRARHDMSEAKIVLLSSGSDMQRQRKDPALTYGVNDYVDVDTIETQLIPVLKAVLTGKKREPEEGAAPPPPGPAGPAEDDDIGVQRAKRLARTVLSDIDLYSPKKVLDAIQGKSFETVFAEDLKEGLKHYEKRIPHEVRSRGNFFQEAIADFLEKKRKMLDL